MIPIKKLLVCGLFALLWVPMGTSELRNRGVKNRPVAQKAVSTAIDTVPILRERMYDYLSSVKPFVLSASKRHSIPPNVLMAILFEEGMHRKPVDVSTFGPAQIGLGELERQGLPARPDLLEDDEISIFILAAKLRRLQLESGSLRDAILLHNGYSDYHRSIQLRAKDPRILEILNSKFTHEVYEA
jgi:hypothetical protein